MSDSPHLGRLYKLGTGLTRSAWPAPYKIPANQPSSVRNLWVYAVDPSISRRNGSITLVQVPREKCKPGPISILFEVDCSDAEAGLCYTGRDFDEDERQPVGLGGCTPDPANPSFHAQMVYCVALLTYETFRKALGRYPTWAFSGAQAHEPAPLRLRPFAMNNLNANYTTSERCVSFGFRRAIQDAPDPQKRQSVFTSLSSDIIAHEVTHALFDGLRPYFAEPTNPDVDALHEALADLVALFQRLSYAEFVEPQLGKLRGRLSGRTLLRVIAPLIGDVVGNKGTSRGLRTFEFALEQFERSADGSGGDQPTMIDSVPANAAPHQRGQILAEAVFDAYHNVLNHKLDPLFELATGGTGVLPAGKVPAALLKQIVRVTARTAEHFLTICIRAVDYCPPVHVNFGDYLRALITADFRLVQHDPHGYREAIIAAFTLRGIRPRFVTVLSESALLWEAPGKPLAALDMLALGQQRFIADPSIPLNAAEVERQACLFGDAIAESPGFREALGLRRPDATFSIPEIATVRPSRRIGPDNQVSFDLIIEVVQSQMQSINGQQVLFRGGSTVVLGPHGEILYIVRKRVDQQERMASYRAFLSGPENTKRLERLRDVEKNGFRGRCFVDPAETDEDLKS